MYIYVYNTHYSLHELSLTLGPAGAEHETLSHLDKGLEMFSIKIRRFTTEVLPRFSFFSLNFCLWLHWWNQNLLGISLGDVDECHRDCRSLHVNVAYSWWHAGPIWDSVLVLHLPWVLGFSSFLKGTWTPLSCIRAEESDAAAPSLCL